MQPLGTNDSVGDFNRYRNSQVDALLSQIAGTNDKNAQNQAFYKIEQIFAQQLPEIREDQNRIADEISAPSAISAAALDGIYHRAPRPPTAANRPAKRPAPDHNGQPIRPAPAPARFHHRAPGARRSTSFRPQ